MPRKLISRPGPKSKKRSTAESSELVKSFMGDGSTPEESVSESETFRSADLDNQTDYNLDFTTSRVGLRSNSKNVTRSPEPMQDEQPTVSTAARKSGIEENVRSTRKRRKQLNPERRDRRFWKLVRKLQLRTDNLIPKASFARVVREIMTGMNTSVNRLTITTLEALQEASEMYLTTLFQDAYSCTLHRGRVTLNVKDIELTRYLRGPKDAGN